MQENMIRTFSDIHIHALFGVDDGAKSEDEMHAMIDAVYQDGTRLLCLTPHFHPGYFGDNRQERAVAFEKLTEYTSKKYPDLSVFLGNELRYSRDCLSWLKAGDCLTLGGSRYLLVDFSENEAASEIVNGLHQLQSFGYTPVLAHAERYGNLHSDLRELCALKENGVIIQMDATSPFGGWGFGSKRRSRKMLAKRMVDVVSSDAHDLWERPPGLTKCFEYISERCGKQYAEAICQKNAAALFEKVRILNT